MSDDTETLDNIQEYKKGNDFPSMLSDLFKSINWKVALFLMALSIFIFTDYFIENILCNINGALCVNEIPSTKGTLIQVSILTVGYIIFDLLVQGEFV